MPSTFLLSGYVQMQMPKFPTRKADNPPSANNKSKGRKKKGLNDDGPAAQTKEKHPDQANYTQTCCTGQHLSRYEL